MEGCRDRPGRFVNMLALDLVRAGGENATLLSSSEEGRWREVDRSPLSIRRRGTASTTMHVEIAKSDAARWFERC